MSRSFCSSFDFSFYPPQPFIMHLNLLLMLIYMIVNMHVKFYFFFPSLFSSLILFNSVDPINFPLKRTQVIFHHENVRRTTYLSVERNVGSKRVGLPSIIDPLLFRNLIQNMMFVVVLRYQNITHTHVQVRLILPQIQHKIRGFDRAMYLFN